MRLKNTNSPWSWLPTLYFAEGIPYVVVMTIALVFYHDLGLSNAEAVLYTSWLYLPWVIKPFWSPIVDIFKTKRWWIVMMQTIIAVSLAGIALTLNLPHYLQLTLAFFWLMAFSSATHDIAADGFYMLALNANQQSFYVGIRSTFYRIATVAAQGGLLVLVNTIQNEWHLGIEKSWTWIFIGVSILFLVLSLYHTAVLPLPVSDKTFRTTHQVTFRDFFTTIRTFFVKQNLVIVIAFLLLYRLPEALLVKVCPLFFLDAVANGGLGLDKSELGFVQGTIGVIGLLVGGILGGIAVSKVGLKKCLWPMAIAISVPDALYVMLAYWQSADIWVVSLAVFVEQLGYGFGFTAYMLYMIYVSRGNHQTSHYAFCTGFMALSMMIPGLFAGFLQEQLGYAHFFIIVTLLTAFTFLSISIIKIEDDYGKKTKK